MALTEGGTRAVDGLPVGEHFAYLKLRDGYGLTHCPSGYGAGTYTRVHNLKAAAALLGPLPGVETAAYSPWDSLSTSQQTYLQLCFSATHNMDDFSTWQKSEQALTYA